MLKNLHFVVGLLTLLHFAITGILMRTNFFGIDAGDIVARMMFRSNHIYILFVGLLNLLIYFVMKFSQKKHGVLFFSSSLILFATLGLNFSFYFDPITHSLQRSLTRFSLIGCLLGTATYLLSLQVSKNN